MAVTGSFGTAGTWVSLASPISLGVSAPTGAYPNGTITFDGIKSGSASWMYRSSNTSKITVYLCDSAGNNKVELCTVKDFTIQYRTKTTPNTVTIDNSNLRLTGVPLYIVATGNTNDVGIYGKTNITINTSNRSYTMTVAKGTGISSVTGGGSKTYNSSNAITATASTGYSFKNWTSNNGGSFANANSSSTNFTMPAANVTVTANGQINSYTLTVAKGTGGSAVTGGGTVNYGSSNNITATAANGYTFKNWTSNNGGTFGNANSASTTFTMPAGNVTVTANFTANSYTLTVAKGTGISSVSGGGSKQYTSSNAISATVATGYTFSKWTSNNGGTFTNANSASTNFTMPIGNTTVTASATINSYTLTVAKGTGIASVTGGGTKNYASSNAITATASTGYSFKNWTSNNGGSFANANSSSTNFTMPAGNVTVTANGQINSYTLTVAKGTGIASVTGGGSVNYASSNNISATVSNGYTFSGWTSNNGGTFGNASNTSTTFTMPAGNTTVTANATVNSYTLTVAKGTGISSVSGGGSKNYGSSNAISATVATGYTFNKWTSNNGGTFTNANAASTNFTMPIGNTTVTASATVNSYALTVAKGTGISAVTGGGTVNYGSSNNITATVSTGYTFNKWTSSNGGTFGNANSASTTFTMPAGNATVTASATINSYTLTVAKGTGGSAVTGGGTVNYGSSNAISATASTGYSFKNWTSNNGGTFGNANSASTTFTMPAGNVTVTANFNHLSYTVSSAVSPTGGGSVTLGKTSAYYADSVSISASAATGYTFSGWTTTGGTIASASSASTALTMPAANTTVTASFTHNSYTLSSAVSPSGCGTVTLGKTSAYYADSISISATPATGYSFSGWTTTGGTIASASSASTTLTMPAANATVTATFVKNQYTVTAVASPNEGGTAGGSGTYDYGSTVNIVAIPETGYEFSHWEKTAGVIADASSATTTFTVPAENASITAVFIFTFTGVNVVSEADDFRGGTFTKIDGTYDYESTINLTATVNQYYEFSGWTATAGTFEDATALSTVYTVPATGRHATITAHFTPTHLVYPIDAGDVDWTTGNGTLTIECNMINTTEITGSVTSDPAILVLHLGVKNDEGDDD